MRPCFRSWLKDSWKVLTIILWNYMTINWNDLAWNDLIEVTGYQPKSTVRILRCIEYSWRFKQFAKVVAYPVKQIKRSKKLLTGLFSAFSPPALKLGCKLTQTTNYSWTNMYACTFVWTLTFLRFLGVERIDTGTTEVLFLLSFPQDIKACWKFFGVLVWPALVDPWSVLLVTLAGVLSAPR